MHLYTFVASTGLLQDGMAGLCCRLNLLPCKLLHRLASSILAGQGCPAGQHLSDFAMHAAAASRAALAVVRAHGAAGNS